MTQPTASALVLGLGCDRGTAFATLQEAVSQALHQTGAQVGDVVALASIDLKADEPCLLALAQQWGCPIHFYPAAVLAPVPVPNPSATVLRYTGTPSVSEAAALLAAGTAGQPAPIHALCLEKHKWRGADGKNATVSIARLHPPMSSSMPPESHSSMTTSPTPDTTTAPATAGKIMLVGIGPGSAAHMTARAREAIIEADTVIGYVTYIKLVADLLDGKEVIRKSMTEELDRAVTALESARQGKKVALISSGDAGVYGMAGPTYEVLFQAGWTPDDPVQVEIIPGASALNSCAALVGAPLTHDFCAISLSDLLTPWPTIARRLDAVAMADFVVALYNPKSGRRTRQIVEAQRLFLRHRRPDTPVAIVKSAYRRRESIVFTTLDQMAEADIGMLSTVLIGNSNTVVRHGLMVTPRGYANKYDLEQNGETRDGEKRGRSLSTGLLGWLETLQAQYAEGTDIATLAQQYRLPADYIRATLLEPISELASTDTAEEEA